MAAGSPTQNTSPGESDLARLGRHLTPSVVLLLIVLAGLPIAVWFDMKSLSENTLRTQAADLTSMIDNIRGYYAEKIVGRVLANGGVAHVIPDYLDQPGGIPIPATLSLELGAVISDNDSNIRFRFFSDYPFKNRAPHSFDAFETQALETLRADPGRRVFDVSGSIFDRRVRLVTPVIMNADCVNCHNAHPDSPKRDWKIGDVRGIEEFTVRQQIGSNVLAFKYLLGYFVVMTTIGVVFIWLQHRQFKVIERFNRELGRANSFLSSIAQKIAKYLAPQHYHGIFSGEKDALIATERKKLTIFFSDVVNFTTITERLQPEELTRLLNEYLTAMSQIATAHGGMVNKFFGDAMLIFFGDPDTRGVAEDAKACLDMAFSMQRRLIELDVEWRNRGVEEPFRARMGVNTGFVNIGNFGSDNHMDFTIIGAEVNLAARLQAIADPGGIVVSNETYSLVRKYVKARSLEAVTLKGVNRPVTPYVVEGPIDPSEQKASIITERGAGLDLYVDMGALDAAAANRACRVLEEAAAAIRHKQEAAETR